MGRKIIDIYHRVSRIERKKKKCDSWFDFIASSSSDSIVSPLWNVARLKIIETHTRGNSVRKGGKEWSEVRIRSYAKKLHSRHALLSRRIERVYTRSVQPASTSFRCWSNSTCFRFFFFFKGENRLYLPFSFDDSAIKLNIDRATKGI